MNYQQAGSPEVSYSGKRRSAVLPELDDLQFPDYLRIVVLAPA